MGSRGRITWVGVARSIVPYGRDLLGRWWVEDRCNDPTGPFDSEADAISAAEMSAMLIRTAQTHESPPVNRYEYRDAEIVRVGWEYRGVVIERTGWDYVVWLDFVRPLSFQPKCLTLDRCRRLIVANRG